MKSKLIGFSFLFLSMILLFIWFQINNETQKLEEKLSDLDERIILMKESNKVLLSEFSAHTNPEYIELVARKNLGLVHAKELIYYIPPLEKNSFQKDN